MQYSQGNLVELQATSSHQDLVPSKMAVVNVSGNVSSGISENARLERLGKRPQLNRSFGFMSILGFSCSALMSWEGALVNSVIALLNGGSAGVIWGFLINWIGATSVFATLGELASMAPTAAGQCEALGLTSCFVQYHELTDECQTSRSLGRLTGP